MKLKTFLFIVVLFLPASVISQDTIVRKNIISMAFPSLLDKTLSLSYYRQINNHMYFTINPRYRAVIIDPLIYWDNMLGYDNHFIRSRVLVRSGVQLHKRMFFVEPLFQIDVGWARDIWNEGYDSDRDYLEDIDYSSYGFILLGGMKFEKDENYFKIYLGVGRHYKHTTYTQKGYYDPMFPESGFQSYTRIIDQNMSIPSIHLGLESGHRF